MNQFFKLSQKEITTLSGLFVIWRVATFVWSWFADRVLSYEPSFPYAYTLLNQFGLPQWLYSWANFDGVHYLTIAERGYAAADLIQAFFPLYPLLMTLLNSLGNNSIISGLLISNVAFWGTLIVLYSLVKSQVASKLAFKTAFVLLLFPTSFFFGAVYSESLFLLLVLLAFYCAHRKKWLMTGLFVAAATATRIVGVFLIPALLVELYLQSEPKKIFSAESVRLFVSTQWRDSLFVCLGFIGIGAYMVYLNSNYGDPLYFWHVQSEFGSGRQESIVLLPQVIWRYLKILTTVPFSQEWLVYLQEVAFGLIPFALVLYYWLKRKLLKASWALFSLSALLLPTVTGNFSSMPRYALVAFPLFIIIATWMKSTFISGIILTVSGILLLLNLLLFIQGYWVA